MGSTQHHGTSCCPSQGLALPVGASPIIFSSCRLTSLQEPRYTLHDSALRLGHHPCFSFPQLPKVFLRKQSKAAFSSAVLIVPSGFQSSSVMGATSLDGFLLFLVSPFSESTSSKPIPFSFFPGSDCPFPQQSCLFSAPGFYRSHLLPSSASFNLLPGYSSKCSLCC